MQPDSWIPRGNVKKFLLSKFEKVPYSAFWAHFTSYTYSTPSKKRAAQLIILLKKIQPAYSYSILHFYWFWKFSAKIVFHGRNFWFHPASLFHPARLLDRQEYPIICAAEVAIESSIMRISQYYLPMVHHLGTIANLARSRVHISGKIGSAT